MGYIVPCAAIALGANIVEKHFILSRRLGGPDSAFSMEPTEFEEMVNNIRQTEEALGDVSYNLSENDYNRRRSLFVVKNIKSGETFSSDNIKSIRPGFGLHPKFYHDVLGKTASKTILKGTPLNWDLINDI